MSRALQAVTESASPEADEEAGMFPLRDAKEAGKMLGRSERWMNAASAAGDIPYVDFDLSGKVRGAAGRSQRMFRNDHLIAWVQARTVDAG